MLERILLISLTLISFINEVKLKDVKVHYLETDNNVEVDGNENNFVLCVHMKESLKKNDTFYLLMASSDKTAKMNTKLYYNFQDESCQKSTVTDGDIRKFFYYNDQTVNEINSDIFYYEYKITKPTDNDKYAMVLVSDFSGNKIKIQYSNILPLTLVIIIVVAILGGIVLILLILIIICCCIYRSKKVITVKQQYQTSFVNEPIIP